MNTIRRVLVTAGATALLCVTFPLNAQAAAGEFLYHTQPGDVPHVVNNPVDNRCYSIGNGDGAAENDTNRDVLLYSERGCRGDVIEVLNPGQSDDSAEFASYMFVR